MEEVQVWRVDLATRGSTVRPGADDLAETLSMSERARAARYRFATHRRRFVVRRAALRAIVGRRLDLPPADVPISATPAGRPFVAGAPFALSLAHSGDVALIALAAARPESGAAGARVGIDVECIDGAVDPWPLLETFCAPDEQAALAALPPPARRPAALRAWTAKEAIAKARGDGLRTPPAQIMVLGPSADDSPWRLVEVDAGPGVVATLALAREEHARSNERSFDHGLRATAFAQ